MKPMRLLDAFCGAGGCSVGYYRAGFEVVGVDIVPQPRYPFEFHQADAFEFIADHGHEFDVIGASPPCQPYSITRFLSNTHTETYPDLIAPLRALLVAIDKPYIIENVMGAPLLYPIRLNGLLFGLRVLRDRLFETSPWMLGPLLPKKPPGRNTTPNGEYDRGQYGFVCVAGNNFNGPVAAKAMGIDWMTRAELAQAIPPAYTEWIGRRMLEILL